jgi:hypothetical protein
MTVSVRTRQCALVPITSQVSHNHYLFIINEYWLFVPPVLVIDYLITTERLRMSFPTLLVQIWARIRDLICFLLGMPQEKELKTACNKKCRLPKRIILVRHGQSIGNVDETAYATTPDWKIPLTQKGKEQAQAAGQTLSQLLQQGESLNTYVSPYLRTMETWQVMKQEIDQNPSIQLVGTREEPRIAEQQFGNFQNPHLIKQAKEQRHLFGRFFIDSPMAKPVWTYIHESLLFYPHYLAIGNN